MFDAPVVAALLWAADNAPSSPWSVLSIVIGAVVLASGGALGWAGLHQTRVAQRGSAELEGVKTSVSSLESALARSDIVIARQDRQLQEQANDLRAARADISQQAIELNNVRQEFTAERLRCAAEHEECNDRVRVLSAQILGLGHSPGVNGDNP